MKGKGEVKGWITRHGVHVPIYGDYTVRGGVEPKAKSAKVKSGKKPTTVKRNMKTGQVTGKKYKFDGNVVKGKKSAEEMSGQKLSINEIENNGIETVYSFKDKNGNEVGRFFESHTNKKANKMELYDKNHASDDSAASKGKQVEGKGAVKDVKGKKVSTDDEHYDTKLNSIRDRMRSGEITHEQAKNEAFEYEKSQRGNKKWSDVDRNRMESKVRDIFSEGDKKNSAKDVDHDKEVVRLSHELDDNGKATTSNKEIASAYAANKNPNRKFEVTEKDGQYEISSSKSTSDNDIRATYQRQLDEVNDELESAPKSPRLRNEEGIRELQKKKAALESYLNGTGGIDNKGNAIESKAGSSISDKARKVADNARKSLMFDKGYAEISPKHWSWAGMSNDKVVKALNETDPKYSYEIRTEQTKGLGAASNVPVNHTRLYRTEKNASTNSNAGSRYKTKDTQASASYMNTYIAQNVGTMSISGLKKAYTDAPAALKSKIKAEMRSRGYMFEGGKWVKNK